MNTLQRAGRKFRPPTPRTAPVVVDLEQIDTSPPSGHRTFPAGTLVRQSGRPGMPRTPRLLGMVLGSEPSIGARTPWLRVQWMGQTGTTVQNPKYVTAVTAEEVRPFLERIATPPNTCPCPWCVDLRNNTRDRTRRSNHCPLRFIACFSVAGQSKGKR